MKATRDQLKSLVRELLVEILQDGLGPAVGSSPVRPVAAEARRRQAPPTGPRRPTFDPRLDSPVGSRTPTDALKEAVRLESGGNPILADILADTAMTTLPSQLSNGDAMGRPTGGGTVSRSSAPIQQEQFRGDPTEIFVGGEVRDDGTSAWADLAFMPAKKPL